MSFRDRLLTVAGEVCELEIANIRRVTAFCYWNDMVNCRAQRMWEFEAEIDRLAADAADTLRCIDLLLVALKLRSLSAVVIRSQVGLCHKPPP